MIYLLMGVLGSGKTTVGVMLASKLHCAFHDGDDYHSESNRRKLAEAVPLTDADRKPWLFAVRSVIDEELAKGGDAVVACSALKEKYRRVLIGGRKSIRLVYLKGTPEVIASRVKNRRGNDASPELLPSQFEALEEPKNALTVDITMSPESIVDKILAS
jgi:gluconokinase